MHMHLAFSLIAMFYVQCHAAGFNCVHATSPVERLICSNPALSALDDEMARLYSAALARAKAPEYYAGTIATPEKLRAEQRAWLAKRDRCTNPACVDSEYISRLAFINAAIRIPQYDASGPKSDDMRFVGIGCDQEAKTLEIGYFNAHNLPSSGMSLWHLFDLKTNSSPDERGNQHVLAVHDVTHVCSFGTTRYVIKIQAVPVSWNFTGPCGGLTYGRATIYKNGRKLFDEIFETCESTEIIAKVRLTAATDGPTITRMPYKEYYGYEK